jgi:CrcB protein
MIGILAVFIGGSLGAALRYLISQSMSAFDSYYATFLINILGSFFIGFVSFYAIKKAEEFNPNLKLLLTTGICGGFTTFSTFSLEMFKLFQSNQAMIAFSYMFMSLFSGLFAVMLGMVSAKRLLEFVIPAPTVLEEEFTDEVEDAEEMAEV